MSPKIGPGLFSDQSCAPKNAPEPWGQKFKRSHGGLFLADGNFGNFGNFGLCPRAVPLGNPATVPDQILAGLQSRNATEGSSEMDSGRQK